MEKLTNTTNGPITKSYANSYLYSKNNTVYEKALFDFIMNGEQINKLDESFQSIKYDVKRRQVCNSLVKVIDSNQVILLMKEPAMPKAFKVFVARDIKNDKKNKVFIDCDCIRKVEGEYKCLNIDIFVAYLLSGVVNSIYYSDPKNIIMNNTIIEEGAYCFASLFTNIIDYLYKVSSIREIKDKCTYLAAMYYVANILNKDITDSVKQMCRRISGLSERQAELLELGRSENMFLNIKFFIDDVSKALRLSKLTLDVFLEKWIYLYGPGTQFALELFPAFSTMLTNVYVGCYINNQKTIEKVTGRHLVAFTNAILKISSINNLV